MPYSCSRIKELSSFPSAISILDVTLPKVADIIAISKLNMINGMNIVEIINNIHWAIKYLSVEKSPKAIK